MYSKLLGDYKKVLNGWSGDVIKSLTGSPIKLYKHSDYRSRDKTKNI